ncbi:hypothetical protein NS331_04410 [Pseudacidovorax intermedius]|uniref:Secreted protein n=1 Tax=Pseudacidovorax intermedius TaxID=433924 RepID=A0A147H7P3_9BURK|nr:hypothetical protein NS331_04410 [Pseudacidovorax intermedius]
MRIFLTPFRIAARTLGAATLVALSLNAAAQESPLPGGWAPPQNVLQLSASGTVEVQQDTLTMTLGTTRDGTTAAAVQTQLKTAIDGALAEAKRQAQPSDMEVRTGDFSLSPRYDRNGKINGWQGSAQIVLEGRDFARIAQVAGRIDSLSVMNVGFSLSREQTRKLEAEAQAQAIDNFRRKADELARGFGFSGYTLRQVSVSGNQGMPVRPRMMAAEAMAFKADAAAPVPVEAGKAAVTVNVSGSVQLK